MKYNSHSIAVTEYETREAENASKLVESSRMELHGNFDMGGGGHRHPSIDVFRGADAGENIYTKGEVIAGR
jgi:hypothetical protein